MQAGIYIFGYGGVGYALMQLIHEKREMIARRYHVDLRVTGVETGELRICHPQGLDLQTLILCGKGSRGIYEYCRRCRLEPGPKTSRPGHILVDASPTDIRTGGPGLPAMLEAIETGMDIVAISKGALVSAFTMLQQKAEQKGRKMRFSGAAAAALPTLDVGMFSLTGAEILSMEGILNGTTNYILTSMHRQGTSFEAALQEAQQMGIAEPDCHMDISGTDSACKLLLLANCLIHAGKRLEEVELLGIDTVTPAQIEEAQRCGGKIKLIARAGHEENGWKLQVAPTVVHAESLLWSIDGTEKALMFHTDTMGRICVAGGASNPRGAAAAALKDILLILQ